MNKQKQDLRCGKSCFTQSKTFYSSTNKTEGLLASLTTITESLHPIRTPINTHPKSQTFYSSTSDKNCTADFITRKIETSAQFLAMRLAFARLLASSTTMTESLYSIRSLINTRPISQTFYSSTSDKNCSADFITRKIETIGSIFSHETQGLLASLTTITESLYKP